VTTSADFCTHFRLQNSHEITSYFPKDKYNLVEKARALAQRIGHLFLTAIWIDESTLCQWASKHPEQKISHVFKDMPLERKLIRVEQNMVVEKPSFITAVNNTISFLFEFIKHPVTVGAILPSSNSLAKEIVSEIPKDLNAPKRLILEVGPGTGIFTDKIIKRMNPFDELHLVEFDADFSAELSKKYAHIPNVKVFQADIAEYKAPAEQQYDYVVSGLPLNGFRAPFVQKIFTLLGNITKPQGKISYFEYLLFPDIKKFFSNQAERKNMDSILRIKQEFYKNHPLRKANVYLNIPGARVLHHQI
jgi:phospholipid N-methyltransferase